MRPVSDPVVPPYVDQFQRVNSYAEIQEIMRSQDFHQDSPPERKVLFHDTLIMSEGDRHLQLKTLFSSLFTKEAITYYELRLLEPVIEQVMSELRTSRGPDGLARTDLAPLVRTMLLRISARVTGVDGVDTPERTERFRVLVAKLGEATTAHWSTRDKDVVVKEGLQALEDLVKEFLEDSRNRRQELVRQYKAGTLKKEDLPRDVLTLICLHGDDNYPGDTAYYAYAWRQCVLFLHASTQTTTHELPHVAIHLDEWIKEHPEQADKVNDPAFLRLAVGESLRLHQSAPVKFRVAAKDMTLSTGRKIDKDEMVALFAPRANLETELFGDDAREFNPYRKLPAGMQPWGLTFGAGVHMCLGRSLVTGIQNRSDDKTGADGTMVKILKMLYSRGMELDPANPPKRTTLSYHDAYESVPIILRKL